jgi:hypothetical protein
VLGIIIICKLLLECLCLVARKRQKNNEYEFID